MLFFCFFLCKSVSTLESARREWGARICALQEKKKSPPAASKMRDGGTSHKLTALKSESLQGTVCPCMQQIGLIILQLCDKGKVASDATRTPFFLLYQVWLHTSQQWLTILKPTNTLYGFFAGHLVQKDAITYSFVLIEKQKALHKMLTALCISLAEWQTNKQTDFCSYLL